MTQGIPGFSPPGGMTDDDSESVSKLNEAEASLAATKKTMEEMVFDGLLLSEDGETLALRDQRIAAIDQIREGLRQVALVSGLKHKSKDFDLVQTNIYKFVVFLREWNPDAEAFAGDTTDELQLWQASETRDVFVKWRAAMHGLLSSLYTSQIHTWHAHPNSAVVANAFNSLVGQVLQNKDAGVEDQPTFMQWTCPRSYNPSVRELWCEGPDVFCLF